MTTDVRGFTVVAVPNIDGDGRSWVEVMPAVEKDRNGSFYFTMTTADLDALVGYIESNPDKIPVDRDHAGAQDTGSTRAAGWFTGQAKTLARGEQNPNGETQQHDSVWAEVAWTPQAVQEIRDGEFRFLSPEWRFSERDKKTGLLTKFSELVAATLTNRPHFRQLAAVKASDLMDSDQLDALTAKYDKGVAELVIAGLAVDDSRISAAIEDLLAADSAPYGDVPYADPGYQKDGKKRYPLDSEAHCRAAWSYINMPKNAAAYSAEQLASIKSKIRAALKKYGADIAASQEDEVNPEALKALGLAEDADSEAILAAINELNEKAAKAAESEGDPVADKPTDYMKLLGLDETADPDKKITALIRSKEDKILALEERITELGAKEQENAKLLGRIEDLEKRDRVRDIEVILARAVDKGQVLPAEKEQLTETFSDNVAGLRSLLTSRPAGLFNTKPTGSGSPGDVDRYADDVDVAAYVKANFRDSEDPVDTESAKFHLQALELLKENGKGDTYTSDEYVDAFEKAKALVY